MLPQKAKKSHPGHGERLNVPEIGKKDQQRSPKKGEDGHQKDALGFSYKLVFRAYIEFLRISTWDSRIY
jgi:hypothetical protein